MPDLALKPLFLNENAVYAGKHLGGPWDDVIGEGIRSSGDFAVSQNGTPDLSVNVAAGMCWVKGNDSADTNDEQPTYRQLSTSVVNVPLTEADPTNPRIDRIVLRVYDDQFTGVDKKGTLEAIAGTPAGSPSAPAEPENSYTLATVQVDALETTILNADITDQRSLATVAGGHLALKAASVGTPQLADDSVTPAKRSDVGVHAYTAADQTVTATAIGSADTLTFAELTDLGGDYASNTFTAPVAGFYLFQVEFHLQSAGATNAAGVVVLLQGSTFGDRTLHGSGQSFNEDGSNVGTYKATTFQGDSTTGEEYRNSGRLLVYCAASETVTVKAYDFVASTDDPVFREKRLTIALVAAA